MIAIKDMEMPKDCPMCPMSHWDINDEFTGCEVVGGKKYEMHHNSEYANSSTRPSWCPLIDLTDDGK